MSPTRPLGPCTYPGCPGRATAGHGRCGTHQRQDRQRFDQQRGTATERGYDAAWRRLRAEVLRERPVCQGSPGKVCFAPAVDVHHTPRYLPGTDHRDYRLTALCKACHGAITSRQVR